MEKPVKERTDSNDGGSQEWTRQSILYFLVSAFASVVNIGTRPAFNLVMPFLPSVICSYLTGMVVNYLLSSRFVFLGKGRSSASVQVIKFFAVALVGLLINSFTAWLAYNVLVDGLHLSFHWWFLDSSLAAHLIAIFVTFFWSFLGHKLFSFRRTGQLSRLVNFISRRNS